MAKVSSAKKFGTKIYFKDPPPHDNWQLLIAKIPDFGTKILVKPEGNFQKTIREANPFGLDFCQNDNFVSLLVGN